LDDTVLRNLSLVVVTLNEEENISRCLESASGVGEVIVVDSFSTDGTVEVAEEFGARVFQREYISSADQKNWAVEQAEKEWVLILDADESLSTELKAEITSELASPRADAYKIRRKSEFMGRVINHCGWGKDWVVRLFKKGKAFYPERTVHEKLRVHGKVAKLKGTIEHRPYRGLSHYMDKLNDYARRAAVQLRREGKGWFPQIVVNPPARFVRMYILQLGFLDGWRGFVLCFLAAVSVFFKYAFLLEMKETGDGEGEGKS